MTMSPSPKVMGKGGLFVLSYKRVCVCVVFFVHYRKGEVLGQVLDSIRVILKISNKCGTQ